MIAAARHGGARGAAIGTALGAAVGASLGAAACRRGATAADDPCARVADHVAAISGSRAAWRDGLDACRAHPPAPATIDCLLAAPTVDALAACLAADPSVAAGARAADEREWGPMARQLTDAVAAYVAEHHRLPPSAGPTPAPDACCRQPAGACPPDAASWTGAWQTIGFAPEAPTRWSFWLETDGDGLRARLHAMRACGAATLDEVTRLQLDGDGRLIATVDRGGGS